ncbi:type II toxin-antitoxin system RelE/ParE family toxin [Nostoc sp. NIES-2111]
MEYYIAREASQDLDEILDYFLVHNVNAGERFIREFNKTCQNIAQFPNIGRSYTKFDPKLRGTPLNGYIIFYRVFEDSVVMCG